MLEASVKLNYDFIIYIEHRNRDLEAACLLQYELERRGYSVLIASALYWRSASTHLFCKAKIIFVPSLYNNQYLKKHCDFRRGRPNNIINLQQEQVLNTEKNDNYHTPSELAADFCHICWNPNRKAYLEKEGVPPENLLLAGNVAMDFNRPEFSAYYPSRGEYAQTFGLDPQKKWGLFISSFGAGEQYVKIYQRTHDNPAIVQHVTRFGELQKQSRPVILSWIERFLAENTDFEFIYRPHPGEPMDETLESMQKENGRFHVIPQGGIRAWLRLCDTLNNWFSTAAADAKFIGKPCSLLRPVPVPAENDHTYFNGDYALHSYEQFRDYQRNPETFPSPVNEELLFRNYYFDDVPAYMRICDVAEEMYPLPQNPSICDPQLETVSKKGGRPGLKALRYWLYCCLAVYVSPSRLLGKFLSSEKGDQYLFTSRRIEKESLGIYREMRDIKRRLHRTLDSAKGESK